MTEQISAYQEALRKYDNATKKAEEIANTMMGLGQVMKEWQHVTIADGKTQFPVGVGKYSINPKDFPTLQQLAEVLSAWHQIRHDLRNKWAAIPQDQRTGLMPPNLD